MVGHEHLIIDNKRVNKLHRNYSNKKDRNYSKESLNIYFTSKIYETQTRSFLNNETIFSLVSKYCFIWYFTFAKIISSTWKKYRWVIKLLLDVLQPKFSFRKLKLGFCHCVISENESQIFSEIPLIKIYEQINRFHQKSILIILNV